MGGYTHACMHARHCNSRALQGCLIETPVDYFRSDQDVVNNLTDALIQYAMDCQPIDDDSTVGPRRARGRSVASSPRHPRAPPPPQNIPCINDIGVPVIAPAVLGQAGCARGSVPGYNASVCAGCGHYASAFMLTYLLQVRAAPRRRATRPP